MLCSKLHHQGVFSLFDFSYKNQGKPLVNHRSFVNFRLISGLEAHNLQPIGPSTGADGSSVMSANAARPAPSDCPPLAPDTRDLLISHRKSSPPQNHQALLERGRRVPGGLARPLRAGVLGGSRASDASPPDSKHVTSCHTGYRLLSRTVLSLFERNQNKCPCQLALK